MANFHWDTKNPDYGKISKDETGEPDGHLYEKAMDLVIRHVYDFTKEQKRELFANFLTHAASLGGHECPRFICNGINGNSE
ncbi:hypothetical protein [Neobacillus fumarioli]|uniref:hypothetical protein n=1 Tax=Neobacillus fumarioli TaxID=105229 RepID=UPI000B2714AC|nr:hypothetical protein [Neobacillus fumarioli]